MVSTCFDAWRRAEINFEVKSKSAQRSTERVGGILALSNPTHCEMRPVSYTHLTLPTKALV